MRYYDYIDDKLNLLAYKIKSKGKLNLLDIHNHSENFYQYFLEKVYGWILDNLNNKKINIEAIDLLEKTKKIFVQVSAVGTKDKIESSLSKESLKKYSGFTFKFLLITNDAQNLRKQKFKNPYGIQFNPVDDVLDIILILKDIKNLGVVKQKEIYNFIKEELGSETDIVKLDSNLATIIDILSKEKWDSKDTIGTGISFKIERKINFNNLNSASEIINDYKIHHTRIDGKYTEFDKMGQNKSQSVLGTIRKIYIKVKESISDDALFFFVLDETKKIILDSQNFVKIPEEELDLCINILVVDAFIRCKIFKNPEEYKHAST